MHPVRQDFAKPNQGTMRNLDELFEALSKSAFRSKFHLQGKDLIYLHAKGLPTVIAHAEDFIAKRLALAVPKNDGKQTPFGVTRFL
jgi:hypothetical protein